MLNTRWMTKLVPKIWAVIGGLCLAGLLWLGWKLSPWGQLSYFEERTGIDLPTFPSELAVYSDFEMSSTLHMVLPRDRVSRLLAMPSFRRGDQERLSNQLEPPRLFRIRMLPRKYQRLPRGTHMHQAHGCRGRTSWQAILDEGSGALWIEVQYPDWGGDGPSCQ